MPDAPRDDDLTALPVPPTGVPDPDAGHERIAESAMWNSVGYLLSGPLVFGGAGLLLDRWLGTAFCIVVGLLGGMALSLYLVWFRYGTEQR